MELEPLVKVGPGADLGLDSVALVPQSLPISAFRVERRPVWQRVVASGWPMRVAAAACVALVGYLGVVGYSAAQARYSVWQQERATRLAQAGAAGGGSELNPVQQQPNEVKAIAAQTESVTMGPAEMVAAAQPVVVAAAVPATPSELARVGQLVILVRAKSAGQVNASISGLSRRVSEVIAVAPAEAGWQGEVIASATAALAEMPGSAVMAGFASQLSPGQPILVSYGPMAQSAVPMAAREFGSKFGSQFGTGAEVRVGSGLSAGKTMAAPVVDARLRLADWFASRSATTHVLTVRDQPEAIERLMRRLGGSRGVTVELVRLDSPLPEVRLSAGQNAATPAAAKPGASTATMDSLMWWTRPAAQWQRLELPVVVVEQ